jgi:hypothetical protein
MPLERYFAAARCRDLPVGRFAGVAAELWNYIPTPLADSSSPQAVLPDYTLSGAFFPNVKVWELQDLLESAI